RGTGRRPRPAGTAAQGALGPGRGLHGGRWSTVRPRPCDHGVLRLPRQGGANQRVVRRASNLMAVNPERDRLMEHDAGKANWKRWGPYLSERAWGTVREDYSADGDAWNYFPHDHARSRAYRWNEDGMGGFCDDRQHICLAVALWN